MGAADEGILSLLKEKYKKEMSLKQGEKLAIDILKQVMQDKVRDLTGVFLSNPL